MKIIYNIDLQVYSKFNTSLSPDKLKRLSRRDLGELLVTGDILFHNGSKMLSLEDISLFRFLCQLCDGFKKLSENSKVSFSDPNNHYDIKMTSRDDLIRIKDIEEIEYSYSRLKIVIKSFRNSLLQDIEILYPSISENDNYCYLKESSMI